jgi:hypothetical protein
MSTTQIEKEVAAVEGELTEARHQQDRDEVVNEIHAWTFLTGDHQLLQAMCLCPHRENLAGIVDLTS